MGDPMKNSQKELGVDQDNGLELQSALIEFHNTTKRDLFVQQKTDGSYEISVEPKEGSFKVANSCYGYDDCKNITYKFPVKNFGSFGNLLERANLHDGFINLA